MNEDGNVESPYFSIEEPKSQKVERINEEAKARAGLKLLEDMIQRFEKRIEFYNSLEAIDVDISDDPLLHQKKAHAAQITAENLTQERDYLVGLKNAIER
jgi:hypothetical protein